MPAANRFEAMVSETPTFKRLIKQSGKMRCHLRAIPREQEIIAFGK
jgi:hypothetical protein